MLRIARPFWAPVCLAAVVGVATVDRGAAQERPVVIGSDTAGLRLAGQGPEQALTVGPGRLVEISEAAADVGRLSAVRAHDAGPFDSQRYGFSTVRTSLPA
jgi:hypothetical protein